MWRNVTDCFDEEQRHYKDTYLEISEVIDDTVECSLFSRNDGPYEIYIAMPRMDGIVYAEKNEAYELREEIKVVLEKQWNKDKKATSEFIKEFQEKYHITMPFDLYFDSDKLFESLLNIGEDDYF